MLRLAEIFTMQFKLTRRFNMAGSVNKVILIGRLGQDPQVNSTQDGREIANLSIATSESWKDKNSGERKEKTEWHKVVIYNDNIAKLAKNYLKKGSKVYVEGALQTRKYTDKAGIEKYTTEIVLQNFGGKLMMLDGKDSAQPAEEQTYSTSAKEAHNAPLDDDIPFAIFLPFLLGFASLCGIA